MTDVLGSLGRAFRRAEAAVFAPSDIAWLAAFRVLFGLSPADPISYALVAVLLVAAATAAMYVPVRRALRTDPAATLRAE